MKKTFIRVLISILIILPTCFVRQLVNQREGGATGYGLPLPWRFVNTSINPPETTWSWYVFAINVIIIFLVVTIVSILVKNAKKDN